MPHIPKTSAQRYATLGPSNEPAVQLRSNSGAVQGPNAGTPTDSMHRAPDLGGERLSLVRFEVPPEKVFRQLFGKDFHVDEYTGIAAVPGVSRPVV